MRRFVCAIGCLALGLSASLAAGEALDAATLEKVKAATVFIKVRLPEGETRGTGFLAGPGVVVTNAHVLGRTKERRSPVLGIEVVLFSGVPGKEKVIVPQSHELDEDYDLAFLRVAPPPDAPLPEPLELAGIQDLRETLPVFIFGFPFGEALAKIKGHPGLTVGSGHVSGLRVDKNNILNELQIDGDLNPGNSGGPIVLAAGKVVGVSVATVLGTQIAFAIPVTRLRDDLGGRVGCLQLIRLRHEGAGYSFDVKAYLLDPLGKVKKVDFLCWGAKKRALRPRDPETKLAQHGGPGDGPLQTVQLKGGGGASLWTGSVSACEVPKDGELWAQTAVQADEKTTRSSDSVPKAQSEVEAAIAKGPLTVWGAEPLLAPKPLTLRPLSYTEYKAKDGQSWPVARVAPFRAQVEGLRDIVSARNGQELYACYVGQNNIKVLEPLTLAPKDEITTPRYPLQLWCDELGLAAVCPDSKVIVLCDAAKRTLLRAVPYKNRPELGPLEIMGRSPSGALMTLWAEKVDSPEKLLVEIAPNGLVRDVLKTKMDWCQYVGQDFVVESAAGNLHDIRLWRTGVGELKDNRARDALQYCMKGRSLQLADGKLVAVPFTKYVMDKAQTQVFDSFPGSRLLGPGLAVVVEFPGEPLAESLRSDLLVTGFSLGAYNQPQTEHSLFYCAPTRKKIMRQIVVDGLLGDKAGVTTEFGWQRHCYVPGHEILIFLMGHTDIAIVQCGPLAQVASVAVAKKGEPPPMPSTARVGWSVTFRLDFQKPANAQKTTFKIKNPLPGMKLDPNTGAFTWTPTEAQLGKYDIAFVADVDGNEMPAGKWSVEVQP